MLPDTEPEASSGGVSASHPPGLRILIIEDIAEDAELNEAELRHAGIPFVARCVQTRDDFLDALSNFNPDIVIADYTLPRFSALEALDLLRESASDIPLILVTGSQSEEVAVQCLKNGAVDYILKQSLMRLPSALLRALEQKEVQRRKEKAEKRLVASHAQLRALSAHLQSVREEERKTIAREIHDEFGQSLTALRMDLSYLRSKIAGTDKTRLDELHRHIRGMFRLVDASIQSMRRLSTDLRPRILDELGLIPALDWLVEEFERRTMIRCTFTTTDKDLELTQDQATAVFRIVQESLTNVLRHAKAKEVSVRLAVEGSRLLLEIHDDGRGITEQDQTKTASFGILGMKERAHIFGGNVTLQGAPGAGTTLKVELPLLTDIDVGPTRQRGGIPE